MTPNQQIGALLRQALICSVFVAPRAPGLSRDELFTIANLAGFQDGEIGDAIGNVSMEHLADGRFGPREHDLMFGELSEALEPKLLDETAADFVKRALNEQSRAVGMRAARIDRGVIVDRAVATGLDRVAVEGAISGMLLGGQLEEDGASLKPRNLFEPMRLYADHPRRSAPPDRFRSPALKFTQDVVARRSDGRPRHPEPLNAFPDALERIGFRHFRLWWTQTVAELRGSDPNSSPVACAVLSAALVEGALTFAAKHAREKQIGTFQSPEFERPMRSWNAGKLIASASLGDAAAILSPNLKTRAEHLNQMRQRVHAGRMLEDFPAGPPDLKPEEGREAKAIAEVIVRAVIEWLDRVTPPRQPED